ncbi:MAG: hypothetical protein HY544_05740 [Candidatus Diapherotrites archaeon]|uniref:Uncharacterized protein n=1 Tax=Candidatus Iainarchaeum sp. TaxID=3101447 RepID=A0A8T3YL53_9ARCH|nr:hypothetical protein [Candidatus Diapherotrites archaeon]
MNRKVPYQHKQPNERAATLTEQMRQQYAREAVNPVNHPEFAARLSIIARGPGDYNEHHRAAQALATELYNRNEQAMKAQGQRQRETHPTGTLRPAQESTSQGQFRETRRPEARGRRNPAEIAANAKREFDDRPGFFKGLLTELESEQSSIGRLYNIGKISIGQQAYYFLLNNGLMFRDRFGVLHINTELANQVLQEL